DCALDPPVFARTNRFSCVSASSALVVMRGHPAEPMFNLRPALYKHLLVNRDQFRQRYNPLIVSAPSLITEVGRRARTKHRTPKTVEDDYNNELGFRNRTRISTGTRLDRAIRARGGRAPRLCPRFPLRGHQPQAQSAGAAAP